MDFHKTWNEHHATKNKAAMRISEIRSMLVALNIEFWPAEKQYIWKTYAASDKAINFVQYKTIWELHKICIWLLASWY
jgi:hypothetical protein